MKKPSRAIVSLALAVIYLLITLSPLAPLALRSPHLAHAITGECVGECDICGCSLESRASKTCCCWLKKKEQHRHDDDREQAADHCGKKEHEAKPVFTCGCPCGSGKEIALWGASKIEQLPYRFAAENPPIHESLLVSLNPGRLTSHYGDPPDPPPKVCFLPANLNSFHPRLAFAAR